MFSKLKKFFSRDNQSSTSSCLICEKTFPDNEIITVEDDLYFCKPHYMVYKNNNWEIAGEVVVDESNYQLAEDLYAKKTKLSLKEPCFIRTSYEMKDEKIKSIMRLYKLPEVL